MPIPVAVCGVCVRPLAFWDCGFEYRLGSAVCCKFYMSSGSCLCVGPSPRPEKSNRVCVCVCVCVCVSLSVIKCNNNPLHVQWLGGRGQTKKEELYIHTKWIQVLHI
jgi:hypothetical protein